MSKSYAEAILRQRAINRIVDRCLPRQHIPLSIWLNGTVLKPMAFMINNAFYRPAAQNVGISFDNIWIDEVKD